MEGYNNSQLVHNSNSHSQHALGHHDYQPSPELNYTKTLARGCLASFWIENSQNIQNICQESPFQVHEWKFAFALNGKKFLEETICIFPTSKTWLWYLSELNTKHQDFFMISCLRHPLSEFWLYALCLIPEYHSIFFTFALGFCSNVHNSCH